MLGWRYVSQHAGGQWNEGWKVESRMRTAGTTAGSWDSVRLSSDYTHVLFSVYDLSEGWEAAT